MTRPSRPTHTHTPAAHSGLKSHPHQQRHQRRQHHQPHQPLQRQFYCVVTKAGYHGNNETLAFWVWAVSLGATPRRLATEAPTPPNLCDATTPRHHATTTPRHRATTTPQHRTTEAFTQTFCVTRWSPDNTPSTTPSEAQHNTSTAHKPQQPRPRPPCVFGASARVSSMALYWLYSLIRSRPAIGG